MKGSSCCMLVIACQHAGIQKLTQLLDLLMTMYLTDCHDR